MLCSVIFLVRLQERCETGHSWEWKDPPDISPYIVRLFREGCQRSGASTWHDHWVSATSSQRPGLGRLWSSSSAQCERRQHIPTEGKRKWSYTKDRHLNRQQDFMLAILLITLQSLSPSVLQSFSVTLTFNPFTPKLTKYILPIFQREMYY